LLLLLLLPPRIDRVVGSCCLRGVNGPPGQYSTPGVCRSFGPLQRFKAGADHTLCPSGHLLGDVGPFVAVGLLQGQQVRVLAWGELASVDGRVDVARPSLAALLCGAAG